MAVLPIKPMLCQLTPAPSGGRFAHPFTSDRYVYELKWDGHRIIASVTDRGVQLWARSGRLVTPDYREIADAIAALNLAPGTILDGEAIALNDAGKVNLQALQARGLRSAQWRRDHLRYRAFDIVSLAGVDVSSEPFTRRHEALEKLLTTDQTAVVAVSPTFTDGRAAWVVVEANDLEGLIAKPVGARYLFGERGTWLKIKLLQSGPFLVVGWTEAKEGNTAGRELGALIVAEPGPDGQLRLAGKVGTGFNADSSAELVAYMGADDECVFNAKERARAGRDVRWVKPSVVVTVEYAERTDDQIIRFAAYKGLVSATSTAQVAKRVEVARAAAPKPPVVVQSTQPAPISGARVPVEGDVFEAPGSSGPRTILVRAAAGGALYLTCDGPCGRFVWKGGSFSPCKHMRHVLDNDLAGNTLVAGHFAEAVPA